MKHLLILPGLLILIFHSSPVSGRDLTSILPLLLRFQPTASADWGASPPGSADRPDHSWLNQFTDITPIPVTTSIATTLAQCPPVPTACILAIDQLQLNQTVYLSRSHTKIQGMDGNKVTLTNANGGSFITLESGIHDVVIEKLNIDGQSHDYQDKNVFGILVSGENIDSIAIVKNSIHHLFSDDGAHGIGIYGSGDTEHNAITNVIIDNNLVSNMRTGSSESIAINGNVKNWEITNNQISHVNNIAIDAIGGEGTSPVQIVNSRTLPGDVDAARYGFIEYNSVTDMSTATNPSYNNEHSWAGAIYVDGGHHIVIESNTVIGSEWAFELGAENCVTPRHILLKNNYAANSYFGDLYIGGYAAIGFNEDTAINCNPFTSVDTNEGHGYLMNITVQNNQFATPPDSQSPPFIQVIEFGNRIRQTIISQPDVSPQHPDGVVSGDQNSIRTTE